MISKTSQSRHFLTNLCPHLRVFVRFLYSFFVDICLIPSPSFSATQCDSNLCSKVFPVVKSLVGSIASQAFPLKAETEGANPEDKLMLNC